MRIVIVKSRRGGYHKGIRISDFLIINKHKNMKKYFVFALIIGILILPRLSSALTSEEIQAQINALMAQIKQLQEQLSQMQSTTVQWCHTFNVNLKVGDSGNEVYNLQTALEKEGFGAGDTMFAQEKQQSSFGEYTAAAVSGFQQKYKDEILAPLGLQYGTGFVGKATRAKLNKLYGCGIIQPPPPSIPPSCIQVITPALNPNTNECKDFPTPCDVPSGWKEIDKCPVSCGTLVLCIPEYIPYDTGEKDSNSCPIKKCIPRESNQPPTISGVSGPTALKVREIGTWKVKASDLEQGTLSYSVRWGDENTTGLYSAAQKSLGYTQTAEFTHSYAAAGTYNPTFIVTDDHGLSVKTSISVQVGEIIAPSITVLSPNGGESWISSTKQTIKWQDNTTPLPECPAGAYCTQNIQALKTYDVNLATYSPSCPAGMACANNVSAVYKIAQNISTNYYNWTVGVIKGLYDALAPAGSYTVQVCQSGTNICDSSDSYFKITDSTQSSITVLSPNGGESWQIGKSYDIKWNSTGNIEKVSISYLKGDISTMIGSVPNTGSYTWAIPTNLILGNDYKIRIVYAVYAEFNSIYVKGDSDSPFSIAAAGTNLPDLIISDFTWAPSSPKSNENITLQVKVKNIGLVSAQNFSVSNLWDSSGKEINIPNLAPGAETIVQGTIGGLTIPGPNALSMYIDTQNKIVESNENNNNLSKTISVSPTYKGEGIFTLKHWDTLQLNNGLILHADGSNVTEILPYKVRFNVYDSGDGYKLIGTSLGLNIGDTYALSLPSKTLQVKVGAINVGSPGNANWSVNLTVSSASVTPSITVLSPNGGESWQVGSTQTIRWSSSNVSRVSLDLVNSSGGLVVKNLVNIIGNPGSASWIIPTYIQPGQYWMRVGTCSDSTASCVTTGSIDPVTIYDQGDSPFSIAAATSSGGGGGGGIACNSDGTDSSNICRSSCGASNYCSGRYPINKYTLYNGNPYADPNVCSSGSNNPLICACQTPGTLPYFDDQCSSGCQPQDRSNVCKYYSSNPNLCTADSQCAEKTAGASGCTSTCKYSVSSQAPATNQAASILDSIQETLNKIAEAIKLLK